MLFYTVVHLIFRKIFFPFFCQFVLCGGPSPALRAPLSVRRAAPSAAAARFSLPSRWFSRGVRRGSSGAARAGSRPSYPYSCLRWSLCVCSATVRTRAARLRTVGSWRAWKPPGRTAPPSGLPAPPPLTEGLEGLRSGALMSATAAQSRGGPRLHSYFTKERMKRRERFCGKRWS